MSSLTRFIPLTSSITFTCTQVARITCYRRLPPPPSFSSLVLCRNSTEPPFVNILIKSLWLLAAFSPCQMNHRLCVCLVKEIFWFKCFQILARNRRQIHIACLKRFLNDRKIIKFSISGYFKIQFIWSLKLDQSNWIIFT